MEKFFKNPLYTGIATMVVLVIVVAWVWDSHKNSKKDFYGLLPATVAAPITPAV
jgi:hypothetical protein